MNQKFGLTRLFTFMLLTSGFAIGQQVERLGKEALEKLDTVPKIQRAGQISGSKGARRIGDADASGQVEKSRSYSSRGVRLVLREDNTVVESPYVQIPLLFKVGTAELLDQQSAENLGIVAAKLKDLQKSAATFSIEGHASAEGDGEGNQKLSEQRAKSIAAALQRLLPGSKCIVAINGFGARYAGAAATDSESARQADRRVIIVREK